MATGLINNKYRVTRRIGGGSFGEIYMGVGPNNEKVAVKFERVGTRCPQLRHEYKVYRELLNSHGFCSVYYFGTQDNYNVMVMDLLGPSLEDLFNKCARRFSLKTVLQLADQMLERVDTLHSRHLIHRDIKPANFVVGIGDQGANIFCVDFGLSKRYRHPKSLQHIPHRDGRSLTGTPRYASINNHLGIEQSRRDDLESIGYVLVYFLKGTLPWQGLKAKNAQKKYRLILEKKQQVSIAQLCQGCPSQFAEFLAYTRSLKFDAKPDIPYLRKLFRDLYHAQGCASVGKMWDWDAIDADYFLTNSGGGGSAGGPPPMGPPPAGPSGQRPTTSGAMMGAGDGGDDDDYDNSNRKSSGGADGGAGGRPGNTPGVLAYNTDGGLRAVSAAAAKPGSSTQQWGFSRQGVASSGGQGLPSSVGIAGMQKDPRAASTQPNAANVEYGPDGQARRPHTAHGLRGGPPGPGEPAGAGVDPRKIGSAANAAAAANASREQMEIEEDGEAHVVAGARAMMRYRRTRTSSLDGPILPQQTPGAPAAAPHPTQILVGGQGQGQQGAAAQHGAQKAGTGVGAGVGAGQMWATGTDNGGIGNRGASAYGATGGFQQQPQSSRGTSAGGAKPSATSGAAAGAPGTTSWMMSDRPKSAGVGGVIMGGGATSGAAAGAPPSAYTRSNSGVSGTFANTGAGGGAAQGGSNALSYGALKSRFMSGNAGRPINMTIHNNNTSGMPKAAATAGASGAAAGTSTGAAKSTSKLFTLSR